MKSHKLVGAERLLSMGDRAADKGNYRRAISCFRQVSATLIPEASHNIACYLEAVHCISGHRIKFFYKKSLKLGVAESANSLAINSAMAGDKYQCLRWLKIAKRMGNEEASCWVDQMLRSNLNLPRFVD